MATVRAQPTGDRAIRPVVATPMTGRRRRPSGEAPPLPRHLARSTKAYAAALVVAALLELALALRPLRAAVTAGDLVVLRALERVRVGALTDAAQVVSHLGSPWLPRVAFWATLATLLVARRVHHLAAYLLVVLTGFLVVAALAVGQGRARPAGIDIVGGWEGYAHPTVPVAMLALVLTAGVGSTLPAGVRRQQGTTAAAVVLGALCLSRLYLGLDHPTDQLAALAIGWAAPMAYLRLALPDDAFPVTYRGKGRAHVTVDGPRGAAIVLALEQQLGLRATRLEPCGLAGSAGSMPLRVDVTDTSGQERAVFGKLYTVTHLRSDRWYKLARMVLYGRLEDEKPFSTVRRLVEYEDHMLRLLRDAHLPVPQPLGLVEITPEREYVVLMEFLDGAREIGDVDLTDDEIDDGLGIVRRLWQAGVAHRDLKPSNLLVRDGHVLLIDVAFAAVRPTPWRQAVDLANMMLTLALSSSAERVYARALLQFAPADLAEAFAASRSVTVPTQLRGRIRADGRDLARQFRLLAPARASVAIQLWTWRRVLVTALVLAGAVGAVAALATFSRVANLL